LQWRGGVAEDEGCDAHARTSRATGAAAGFVANDGEVIAYGERHENKKQKYLYARIHATGF
jgi:hypothetical protein